MKITTIVAFATMYPSSSAAACYTVYEPVCGSNNKTYANARDLENAKLHKPSLTITAMDECPATDVERNLRSEAIHVKGCPRPYDPVCTATSASLRMPKCGDSTFTVSFVGECTNIINAPAAEEVVGGWSDTKVTGENAAILLSALGAGNYETAVHDRICMFDVKRVSEQVVSGFNYRFGQWLSRPAVSRWWLVRQVEMRSGAIDSGGVLATVGTRFSRHSHGAC